MRRGFAIEPDQIEVLSEGTHYRRADVAAAAGHDDHGFGCFHDVVLDRFRPSDVRDRRADPSSFRMACRVLVFAAVHSVFERLEIGRAWWRERVGKYVYIWVVVVTLKKKN